MNVINVTQKYGTCAVPKIIETFKLQPMTNEKISKKIFADYSPEIFIDF